MIQTVLVCGNHPLFIYIPTVFGMYLFPAVSVLYLFLKDLYLFPLPYKNIKTNMAPVSRICIHFRFRKNIKTNVKQMWHQSVPSISPLKIQTG
jgi:hypothetical protein